MKSYFDSTDLFNAFDGLNSRFNFFLFDQMQSYHFNFKSVSKHHLGLMNIGGLSTSLETPSWSKHLNEHIHIMMNKTFIIARPTSVRHFFDQPILSDIRLLSNIKCLLIQISINDQFWYIVSSLNAL